MMKKKGWTTLVVMMMMVIGVVRSDISQEKNECADQLIGLAPCLGYVGGTGKIPTLDCCTGLKQVIQKSKKCICILVKDRDEPSLGFKINATRALSLPTLCHAPANVSDCPALLNLAPNSPEAKVFEDFFEQGQQPNNNTTTTKSTGNAATSTPASSASPDSAANTNSPSPHHHLLAAAVATLTILYYSSLLLVY